MAFTTDVLLLAVAWIWCAFIWCIAAVWIKRMWWPLKRRTPKQNEVFAAGLCKDFAETYAEVYANMWANKFTRATLIADLCSEMPLGEILDKWRGHIADIGKWIPECKRSDRVEGNPGCGSILTPIWGGSSSLFVFTNNKDEKQSGVDVNCLCCGKQILWGGTCTTWTWILCSCNCDKERHWYQYKVLPKGGYEIRAAREWLKVTWQDCVEADVEEALRGKSWLDYLDARTRAALLRYPIPQEPAPPKFKAGDWVRDKYGGLATVIRCDKTDNEIQAFRLRYPSRASYNHQSHYKLALPRKGEWWQWDVSRCTNPNKQHDGYIVIESGTHSRLSGGGWTAQWCKDAQSLEDGYVDIVTREAVECGCLVPVNFGFGKGNQ